MRPAAYYFNIQLPNSRTILKPGDVILADEPTGALNSKTTETVFSLLRDLSKKYGKTVIMVTHS